MADQQTDNLRALRELLAAVQASLDEERRARADERTALLAALVVMERERNDLRKALREKEDA